MNSPFRFLFAAVLLVAPAALAQYSVPWQLRPSAALNVVRTDTAFAFYEAGGEDATSIASLLLASWKVTPQFAPLVRVGVVHDTAGPESGTSFVNPVVGGTYQLQLNPEMRLALFLGLTVPVGMGGGDSPDANTLRAARSGVLARSAMDNAMFAVNDFTVFPGVGFTWIKGRFSVSAEATVLQLTRVRGEAVQADASRTNFTTGLHLGAFVIPELSLGAELRYQRWLSTPVAVAANAALRDTLTVAAGPRAHLKVAGITLRPGLAFAMGLDDPMDAQRYRIVQLDVPIAF